MVKEQSGYEIVEINMALRGGDGGEGRIRVDYGTLNGNVFQMVTLPYQHQVLAIRRCRVGS